MTVALVLGGASTVWDDVRAALDLATFDAVVACNDVGAAWPGRLDAWVSLHDEKLPLWIKRRQAAGRPPAKRVLGHAKPRNRVAPGLTGTTDYLLPGQRNSGSSGLFAVKVALIDLGMDKAVLCGIPVTRAGAHFFDPREWGGAQSHWQGWDEAMPILKQRVRSMSGLTAARIGRPDKTWLGA